MRKKADSVLSIYFIQVMASDETLIQTRTKWISIYQQLGNITVAARRCGIARSTLQR